MEALDEALSSPVSIYLKVAYIWPGGQESLVVHDSFTVLWMLYVQLQYVLSYYLQLNSALPSVYLFSLF